MIDTLYTIIIYPVTLIIEFVFVFADKIFKETGLSVAFISAAISLLCLPLYETAEKWQRVQRDTMKRLKPEIDNINAAFRGDERFMLLQTFYRQNHYHPVYAMRSTFGVLIQIPFFIAGYTYLSRLETLKGASFLFIKNLGAPDVLINYEGISVNILPIIMTIINCASGAIYTKDFPLKDKIQVYAVALIFLALLYNSPAGLVLYWTLNNIFSLIKHIYHKIKNTKKIIILKSAVSAALLSFIIYIINYKGDDDIKTALAVLSVFILLLMWGIPAIRKHIAARFPVHLQARYTKKWSVIYILGALVLFCAIGVLIPSLLIASSPEEFSYIDTYTSPLFFIKNTALQSAGIFLFWMLILYPLFSKKIKTAFVFTMCFAALSSLVNFFAFPGDYGMISLVMVFDKSVGASIFETLMNIAVLVFVLLFIAFMFVRKYEKAFIPIFSMLLLSIVSYSAYNIAQIENAYRGTIEFHKSAEGGAADAGDIKPIVTFSKNAENLVIIMLDRAHSAFVKYIFEEIPALYNEYDGFVYYPDTVSFNGYTRAGAPPIFGGYEYTPMGMYERKDTPSVTKHNEALLMLPRILSEEAGFAVTVTDPPYPNYSYKEDLRIYDAYPDVTALITDGAYTKQWMEENHFDFPSVSKILKRDMIIYGIFRAVPVFLRRGIYLKGDWCSPGAAARTLLALDAYSVLDYLPRLTRAEEGAKSAALIMVNNLTHEKAFLQFPEYRPANVITNYGNGKYSKEHAYHVNAAALLRLAEWFEYLKKEAVYDNTRIILVADHGSQINYVNDIGLPFALDNLNPLLMVKDFNARGRMKTDNIFMSNADVPSIALKGIITNPVNPWTGKPIDMKAKEKPLYIAISGSVHIGDKKEKQFALKKEQDYYLHGSIFDAANWKKVKE